MCPNIHVYLDTDLFKSDLDARKGMWRWRHVRPSSKVFIQKAALFKLQTGPAHLATISNHRRVIAHSNLNKIGRVKVCVFLCMYLVKRSILYKIHVTSVFSNNNNVSVVCQWTCLSYNKASVFARSYNLCSVLTGGFKCTAKSAVFWKYIEFGG